MTTRIKLSTKLIVTASSLVSICLVVFIAITANYYITRMSENNNELYNAYRISENIKSFRSNVISLDNMQKRYMLTGDARFMEQYQLKETETKTLLKNMEKYFDGHTQEAVFERLRDLTYKKLVEAKELKQAGNLAGYQGAGNTEETGLKTTDEINTAIDELNAGLSQITETLINNSVDYLAVSKKWTLLEIILGVIVALTGVVILFRDINLRNRLENQLRNAKKQAEENAFTKEQFMANMSHEIRTPMNAILGFAELLNKTPLTTTQAEYLNAISNSGGNLLNIINDILDFSKIEAGKLQIERISFNLGNTLNSLRTMFAEKARAKSINFSVVVDDAVPQVIFGDPTRLNQVLINLLSNALKFTEKGSVSLHCELKSLEHDVAQLVFRIKDTGVGIPSDKLAGIFERFNQGNKETTRKFGGTGLGLSIVKNLVELQNGNIYVKSKEGYGSEFVVTLSYPVSYENVLHQNREQKRLPKIGNGTNTVLLVEDNPINQKLASTFLSDFGLNVSIAGNGASALDMLKEKNYDLVLMDIQMPILDGYNAAMKIRGELKLNVPVIAMTAHVIEGEKEKCMSYGMNDYISKPFKEADLHAIISKYIKTESSPAKAASVNEPKLQEAGKVVQLDELMSLSRGNKDFIREMIGIFVEQNPREISDLVAAAKNADFDTIRATAHRMKTSIGFMGMQALLEPLNKIELMAEKKEDLKNIEKHVDYIKHSCERAVNELNEALTNLGKEA